MLKLLWMNGEYLALEEGHVSVEDRGFQFADGIYEVIAFPGREPILLEEHLDRLESSAAGMLLEPWVTRAERRDAILALAARAPWPDAMVYGQITRGAAPRAHAFPAASTRCTELWYAKPLPTYAPEMHAKGVAVISLPDERWANCHLKTVSLLPNCLAKEKAKRAGAFEVLFYNADGIVTEGAAVNVWAVIGGTLVTHPLTRAILPGITRLLALMLAGEIGLPVDERSATLEEFRHADEVFLTSTTIGVLPVRTIDGAPVGAGAPGPMTLRLMDAYTRYAEAVKGGAVRA